MIDYTIRLADCGLADLADVGMRNAILGEMTSELSRFGIQVPHGFATTTRAFEEFFEQEALGETVRALLHGLDTSDFKALARCGAEVRQAIMNVPLPGAFQESIAVAWHELTGGRAAPVIVRSSTSYDIDSETHLAGRQETVTNITDVSRLISGIHEIFAATYSDRAIAHRANLGIDQNNVSTSVVVQLMLPSETESAGIMFTLDTETGFRDLVLITSTFGFADSIVQGAVSPDEFYVHKPTLRAGNSAIVRHILGNKATKLVPGTSLASPVRTVELDPSMQRRFSLNDEDVTALARQALVIEDHFDRPMGIEWAKDVRGQLHILQAMPETVQSRREQGTVQLTIKERGRVLTSGRSIGRRVGTGRARVITDPRDMHRIQAGEVLVTDMTDPDWEPVIKRVAAVVTDRGGRTSHAAIAARELGIAAVVGCGSATRKIADGMEVTVSCAEGDEGFVYEGILDYDLQAFRIAMLPKIPVRLMMNISNPDRAFSLAATPNYGVGLVRVESIINRLIGIHPLAAIHYDQQTDAIRERIDDHIAGYDDAVTFFVQNLAEGIACIAAAVAPHPVIVRLSDLRSHEHAGLIGGEVYEHGEDNPMLGFRGAARYLDSVYQPCVQLECRAVNKVRREMGFTNVQVLVPFVRSVREAARVVNLLSHFGLKRGEDALRLYMMCETPHNALAADEFVKHFDGMSIGSNDLTQLTLGVDRDSSKVADLFDERNASVKKLFASAIEACRRNGKYIGICGEAPSDDLELADWLVSQGIETISLNPETIISTWLHLARDFSQDD